MRRPKGTSQRGRMGVDFPVFYANAAAGDPVHKTGTEGLAFHAWVGGAAMRATPNAPKVG